MIIGVEEDGIALGGYDTRAMISGVPVPMLKISSLTAASGGAASKSSSKRHENVDKSKAGGGAATIGLDLVELFDSSQRSLNISPREEALRAIETTNLSPLPSRMTGNSYALVKNVTTPSQGTTGGVKVQKMATNISLALSVSDQANISVIATKRQTSKICENSAEVIVLKSATKGTSADRSKHDASTMLQNNDDINSLGDERTSIIVKSQGSGSNHQPLTLNNVKNLPLITPNVLKNLD